jgi:hypothetical protein
MVDRTMLRHAKQAQEYLLGNVLHVALGSQAVTKVTQKTPVIFIIPTGDVGSARVGRFVVRSGTIKHGRTP